MLTQRWQCSALAAFHLGSRALARGASIRLLLYSKGASAYVWVNLKRCCALISRLTSRSRSQAFLGSVNVAFIRQIGCYGLSLSVPGRVNAPQPRV